VRGRRQAWLGVRGCSGRLGVDRRGHKGNSFGHLGNDTFFRPIRLTQGNANSIHDFFVDKVGPDRLDYASPLHPN
jgi:hypothetical protein